jgi:hypothetical protein
MRLEDFDNDEDKIIQDRLKRKHGMRYVQTMKAIFKNHGQFVNGYETMGYRPVCVYFGSARTKPEDNTSQQVLPTRS